MATEELLTPWDTHWRRAAMLASIWASFLVGAALGTAVAPRLAGWALLLPALMLFIFGILERTPKGPVPVGAPAHDE